MKFSQIIDLSIVPIPMEILSDLVVTLSTPFTSSKYGIMSKFNGSVKNQWVDLLYSLRSLFDSRTWRVAFSFIILILLLDYFFSHMTGRESTGNRIWKMAALVLQQSENLYSQNDLARNILWFHAFLLCGMFAYLFAGASFTSQFVVPVYPFLVKTFRDLLDSDLRPYFMKNSMIMSDFERGVTPIHSAIWNKTLKMGLNESMFSLTWSGGTLMDLPRMLEHGASFLYTELYLANEITICNIANERPYFSEESIGTATATVIMNNQLGDEMKRNVDRE